MQSSGQRERHAKLGTPSPLRPCRKGQHETCYTSPCCCSYDLYDDATKDSYHLQSQIDRNLRALGKNLKGQSDCKDATFYHFIG